MNSRYITNNQIQFPQSSCELPVSVNAAVSTTAQVGTRGIIISDGSFSIPFSYYILSHTSLLSSLCLQTASLLLLGLFLYYYETIVMELS